uniref:SIS domain-containing protein n=1 Tax=viral metagenome TaxID=1070528 RepID=A0A6C0EII4_9ZZZZ
MDLKHLLIQNTNNFINSINEQNIKKITTIIKSTKRNIYILGVGKNIPLAIYFADILKSVNYPAFNLNCLNLTHGDTGCIGEKDTIIIISNSGNTDELINNIKYIKNSNKFLITTNKYAKLIDYCDQSFVFDNTVEIDGKFNLIPCTSITNFTIIFNFIIYYLMNDNKITLENYNYNHPKGNIGLLSKKVKDIIIPLNETCYNFLKDDINTIILNMFKYKVGYSCIVENDMSIIGLITDHNIRKFLLDGNNVENIEDIITKNPKYINNLEISVYDISKIPYLYIPIVINNKLTGMIENSFK